MHGLSPVWTLMCLFRFLDKTKCLVTQVKFIRFLSTAYQKWWQFRQRCAARECTFCQCLFILMIFDQTDVWLCRSLFCCNTAMVRGNYFCLFLNSALLLEETGSNKVFRCMFLCVCQHRVYTEEIQSRLKHLNLMHLKRMYYTAYYYITVYLCSILHSLIHGMFA